MNKESDQLSMKLLIKGWQMYRVIIDPLDHQKHHEILYYEHHVHIVLLFIKYINSIINFIINRFRLL